MNEFMLKFLNSIIKSSKISNNDKLASNTEKAYQWELSQIKEVQLTSINDIPEVASKLKKIKKFAEIKACYSNAFSIVHEILPNALYIEGYYLHLFPLAHAFNKIGDKYFDITTELVLGDSIEIPHFSIMELDKKAMYKLALETETMGDFKNWYINHHILNT